MSRTGFRQDLEGADIEWLDGTPVCRRFNDVYYSRENGLAESRHVFIGGNRLRERWGALGKDEDFHIFETGFGTGLNFLCAVALWLETAPPGARLHFVSAEKYPLSRTELAGALAQWPELSWLSAALLDAYPPTVAGVHRRWLWDDRVCLTLVFDDAVSGLSALLQSDHPRYRRAGPALADAWFLDGFAPARNPALWTEELFELMACFSHSRTTLATFTVARTVREGLGKAGFQLKKIPGFGRKREMLTGSYRGESFEPPDPDDYHPPRLLRNSPHRTPWHLSVPDKAAGKSVAVVGAGIAGCATAAALVRRGYHVTLLDPRGRPGMEASGNPQGILYPKLSPEDSPLSLFARHALCYSQNFYRAYWEAECPGRQCGVLMLPDNDRERTQFEEIHRRFGGVEGLVSLLRQPELGDTADWKLEADCGLFYPDAGWVSPPDVCGWLADGIPLVPAAVAQLVRDHSRDQWRLLETDGTLIQTADQVVVASSYRALQLRQCSNLPLRPVRGQVTALPAAKTGGSLNTVVCGTGYLAPPRDGVQTLGATYDVDDGDTDVRVEDHRRNLASLARIDRGLAAVAAAGLEAPENLAGRAAIRCTTPDYLPLVGPLPVKDAMARRFAALAKNARADIPLPGVYHRGLWINVGLGSRGLTYGPLAAELLAARINGEILPLSRQLVVALHPARFIMRQVKRKSLPSR